MTLWDFLETKFTATNKLMQTKNPNDVTIPRQAKVNAVLRLIGILRTIIMWSYIVYLLCKFISIKLHITKAPPYQTSIPNGEPDAKVAAQGPKLVQ